MAKKERCHIRETSILQLNCFHHSLYSHFLVSVVIFLFKKTTTQQLMDVVLTTPSFLCCVVCFGVETAEVTPGNTHQKSESPRYYLFPTNTVRPKPDPSSVIKIHLICHDTFVFLCFSGLVLYSGFRASRLFSFQCV